MSARIFALRTVDSLCLSLATVTTALILAEDQGVGSYSRFVSLIMLGTVAGGLATYVAHNVVRTRAIEYLGPWTSLAGRTVLAASSAGLIHDDRATMIGGALLTAVSSPAITSMFHSLSSRTGRGMSGRTQLLAATACGGLLGTLAAGIAVDKDLATWLVGVQIAGGTAGLFVARIHLRVFPDAAPRSVAHHTTWRAIVPVTWRVPFIAGLSFSMGALAPGVVTDVHGPTAGSLAGAVYLLGAVASALVFRTNRGSFPASAVARMRDRRRWFLPAALASILWTLAQAPLALSLGAILIAGLVLHLVQAAFEQATADLDDPQTAGPRIMAVHSVAGVAQALILTFLLPPLIAAVGYMATAALVSGVLLVFAGADRYHRGSRSTQA